MTDIIILRITLPFKNRQTYYSHRKINSMSDNIIPLFWERTLGHSEHLKIFVEKKSDPLFLEWTLGHLGHSGHLKIFWENKSDPLFWEWTLGHSGHLGHSKIFCEKNLTLYFETLSKRFFSLCFSKFHFGCFKKVVEKFCFGYFKKVIEKFRFGCFKKVIKGYGIKTGPLDSHGPPCGSLVLIFAQPRWVSQ